MPWAKLSDRVHSHPKLFITNLHAGTAQSLWLHAISYCADQLTDGFISDHWVNSVLVALRPRDRGRVIHILLDANLFDPIDGGYIVHDYLEDNPSRAEVIAQRKADAQRQALGRDAALRAALRERDADHCRYCDRTVNWNDRRGTTGATYDHVDPRGSSTMDNLVIACRGCNSAKRSRTPDEAGMTLLPPAGAQRPLEEAS